MPSISIPAALRPQVDNNSEVSAEGSTLAEVLDAVCKQYPDFGKRLYKSEGKLNRFINIYVNDEDIRFLENLDTAVSDSDEIAIIPAIAGG